jgi:hypothetical protein
MKFILKLAAMYTLAGVMIYLFCKKNTWSGGVLPQEELAYSFISSVINTIYIAGGKNLNQVWKQEFYSRNIKA